MKRLILYCAVAIFGVALTGCGGGSSASSPSPPSVDSAVADCSPASQKSWVRNHLDDVYLWYDEIVAVDPLSYAEASDYFTALLVRSRDRFSYSMPQSTATALFVEGQETGYGVRWGWGASGGLFAFYVDPAAPAAGVLARGAELLAIAGIDLPRLGIAELNAALFPARADAAGIWKVRNPDGSVVTVGLSSARYAATTVSDPLILGLPDGRKAGYLLFNEQLASAERRLIDAMALFEQQGVDELVLDLRYNGGGYLYIAEETASMVGGAALQGKLFETLLFNDKHPELSAGADNQIFFSALSRYGQPLPQLGMRRLFVLTGSGTCSASESIINSLLPFMPVIRIGSTTCGKPYGFVQANNCQQAYFAIRFQGVNADGRADYAEGFSPSCAVPDDLAHPLGDPGEARLRAALQYMMTGACPAARTAPPGEGGTGDTVPLMPRPALKLL